MIPGNKIQSHISKQVFADRFVLHGVSRPVIRKNNDVYCIAVFITIFNPVSFYDGMFDRPGYWVIADIETGDVITTNICESWGEEFCDAPYARRYDLRLVDGAYGKRFFEETFLILDEVRKEYIETNVFNERRYRVYLRRLLKACPVPYRKFFIALSEK